jgi:hypothetical protein
MRYFPIISLSLICVALLLLIGVTSSTGRPFRVDNLPDKGRNWSCGTCHVNPAGGGQRNAFGKDYERIAIPAGDRYTKALGDKDSDGDGFTNDQEFNANPPTKPWDAKSKPPGEPLAVTLKGKKILTWAKLKRGF